MNSFYDKLFVLSLMLGFMIAQAIYQAGQFKANKTISHFWHGIYRGVWCVAVGAFFWDWKAFVLAAACSLNYSTLINIIRRYAVFHIGNNWTDRAELRLTGGRVWILRVAYIFLLVTLMIVL